MPAQQAAFNGDSMTGQAPDAQLLVILPKGGSLGLDCGQRMCQVSSYMLTLHERGAYWLQGGSGAGTW